MKSGKTSRLRLLCLGAILLCMCISCGGPSPSTVYDKGIKAFSKGDYASAATYFDAIPDYLNASTYGAYSHGIVLFDQQRYAEAEPYFKDCQNFMYGKSRYEYCHACGLKEAGQWAEAAAAFSALRDYEDAAPQAAYCSARAAEDSHIYDTALYNYEAAGELDDAPDRLINLQTQIYSRACGLQEEGHYADALALFNVLGDYLSSESRAIECKDASREKDYEQAEALFQAGAYEEAYVMFGSLSGYRDAANRMEELAEILGIPTETDEDEWR